MKTYSTCIVLFIKRSQAGKPTIMLKVGEWLEGCGDRKGK